MLDLCLLSWNRCRSRCLTERVLSKLCEGTVGCPKMGYSTQYLCRRRSFLLPLNSPVPTCRSASFHGSQIRRAQATGSQPGALCNAVEHAATVGKIYRRHDCLRARSRTAVWCRSSSQRLPDVLPHLLHTARTIDRARCFLIHAYYSSKWKLVIQCNRMGMISILPPKTLPTSGSKTSM